MAETVETEPDCGPPINIREVRTISLYVEIGDGEEDAKLAETNQATELHFEGRKE